MRCDEARDKDEMCQWISTEFHFPYDEVMGYLNELSINWGLSVKAIDEAGQTIGYLTMSDYRIEDETEQIKKDKPELLEYLNSQRYVSIFSFIVAPAYRGTKLNYDMIMSIAEELDEYDFIFVPVMHKLKTHDYWKRWGAVMFYEDHESKFYSIAPRFCDKR